MIIRVKCTAVRAYPGALRDPYLVKGSFYRVLDTAVHTIADETPYIRILAGTVALERPRHMFGPFLEKRKKYHGRALSS